MILARAPESVSLQAITTITHSWTRMLGSLRCAPSDAALLKQLRSERVERKSDGD